MSRVHESMNEVEDATEEALTVEQKKTILRRCKRLAKQDEDIAWLLQAYRRSTKAANNLHLKVQEKETEVETLNEQMQDVIQNLSDVVGECEHVKTLYENKRTDAEGWQELAHTFENKYENELHNYNLLVEKHEQVLTRNDNLRDQVSKLESIIDDKDQSVFETLFDLSQAQLYAEQLRSALETANQTISTMDDTLVAYQYKQHQQEEDRQEGYAPRRSKRNRTLKTYE